MTQDQTSCIGTLPAAVKQIFRETASKMQITSIGVVHPLAPGDAKELRRVIKLLPKLAGALVGLASLGGGPAANGELD